MWMLARFFWNLILTALMFAAVFTLMDKWYFGFEWFAWVSKTQNDHVTVLWVSLLIVFAAIFTTAIAQARDE